jgi:hypothetical protein
MYRCASSKGNVTAAAALVVAILVSLGAIVVRGVGASQMDISDRRPEADAALNAY